MGWTMGGRWNYRYLLALLLAGAIPSAARAADACPARPAPGSIVANPYDIYSKNGTLTAAFTIRSELEAFLHECYIYNASGVQQEAPTLRLNPGDTLDLKLTNRITFAPPTPPQRPAASGGMDMSDMPGMAQDTSVNPCAAGPMEPTSTNIHFHGLNIPPVCHQDDVINTTIANTDAAFEYKFQVPANDAPGMYWYHPHLHGSSTLQVNGGAAGILIVGGMEKIKPETAGLPERVLIIRQQFTNPNSWIAGPYQLTLNYQPAVPNSAFQPIIQMQPGAREFWRVANASTQGFMKLAVLFGQTAQPLQIIALDGIPVTQDYTVKSFDLPPGGRVEFIVKGPPAGQTASFWQMGFDTGPIGNPNPAQILANIQTTPSAPQPVAVPPNPGKQQTLVLKRFVNLLNAPVNQKRTIYFAEATNGTNGPTEFFIGVAGQTPKLFAMSDPPAVVTKSGAVEDWIIQNRTGETHAFHIHQIHFLYLALNGQAVASPQLRDTVVVPAWNGTGPYPYVTLRLDFRDPEIVGTFVFHCHVLDHEDAGMMAKIRVDPQ
jgi:FtsP/CotA-like multicopper oxidase with cupredoxin domain